MNNLFNNVKIGALLSILIILFSYNNSYATHALGGDIIVDCIGPNQYEVTLSIYRDCNGINLPTSRTINVAAACTGLNTNVTVTRTSITDITEMCNTAQSSCGGGTGVFGVEKHIYTGVVTVPAGINCDLRFSWRLCCRNNAITTINGNPQVYVETTIDPTVVPCNNSPKFALNPILFFPVGQPASLNYLVYDSDGDSLYYSMVDALDNTGNPVNYIGGYSGALPLGPGVPITIDQTTGTMTFTPTAVEVAVFAIKVEEFRNGVLIGSVTRDMNVRILPVTNSSPTISGFDNTARIDTVICPNQLFTSDIYLTGTSNAGITGATSNNLTGLTNTQQIVNNDTTILTLNWTPTLGDAGNNILYVVAKSDECPVKFTSSRGYNIKVDPNPPVISTYVLDSTSCPTSTDGSVYHSSTGLLTGYSVNWYDASNNLVGTSDTLSNVGNGWYYVWISNGAGYCTAIDSVNLQHELDVTPPSITCLSNQTILPSPGCQTTLLNYTTSVTTSDNCDSNPTVTQLPIAGTLLYNDTTVWMYSQDVNGNIDSCSFMVNFNTTNSGTDTRFACDSLNWIDGNTYYSTNNTATYTLTNYTGCDSVVTLDLTVSASINTTDVQVACDSLAWIDGNTYYTSNNTATHTLLTVGGCDSIVTLDLSINYTTTSTDTRAVCDSLTWIDGNTYYSANNTATFTLTNSNNCDSIVSLDLVVNNSNTGIDIQTACNSLTWIDGITYTANNNIATFTLTNSNNCDSVVTLDLTIISVDTSVTVTNDTLTANQAGATYQWIDCDNGNSAITGETNQFYIVSNSGNYGVVVTNGSCADTSACVQVILSGIERYKGQSRISVYPNPTNGNTYISLDGINDSEISILDLKGKVLYYKNNVNSEKVELPTVDFAKGIYLVKIKNNKLNQVIKLIKQ
ncbi:MAG: T9SS type A sorting domain-containing protein [Vicingaceae bacterium]